MRLSVIVVATLLVACSPPPPPEPPTAEPSAKRSTPQGDVVGFIDQYGAAAWLGLPYAAPPVDDLRWRAPRPPVTWTGERKALEFGTPCAQYGSPLGGASSEQMGKPMGSEDCLYMNVWAPPDAKDLPVMLWIHGGGNVIGHGGFYQGGHLAMQQKVVVLTFNYRMGPFGWFRHASLRDGADADDASGNYGTLDIVQALHWVRDSISAFGGDPDNVTIFGESAGGTNVFTMLLSPRASGLFHRAISQSGGTGFASVANAENFTDDAEPGAHWSSNEVLLKLLIKDGRAADRAAAKTVAAAMDNAAIAAYLRGKSTWELYDIYLSEGDTFLGPQNPATIQDGEVIRTGDPLVLLADSQLHNAVPTMLGTNREEPKLFMVNDPSTVTHLFGLPLWAKDPASYDREARFGAMSWKRGGADEPAHALTSGRPGSTWVYRWDWDEEGKRLGFIDVSQLIGAAHGLEIPFVFGHWELGQSTGTLFDEKNEQGRVALSEAMMAYWGRMAYDGDPGTGGGDLPQWQPWSNDPGGPRTFVLDTEAGGGIRMTDIEVTRESLIAEMENEPGLDSNEKCRLFARVFRFVDDEEKAWVDSSWKSFNSGACAALDQVALARSE